MENRDSQQESRLLEDYITSLITERGLSLNTASAYRRDISAYLVYLETLKTPPEQAQPKQVREYIRGLRARGLKSKSCSRALISLRGFYSFFSHNSFHFIWCR